MDNFFWATLITDVVHAFVIIGLGTLGAWFLISYYFSLKNRYKIKPVPAGNDRSESLKIILPLRLQAYERIVLFLERIQPSGLVMRVQKPGMNAQEMQLALIRAIREEYDYNQSQQVYISSTSWEMVKNAREESISIINRASQEPGSQDSAEALASAVFKINLENENPATTAALNYVKDEARLLM